MLDSINSFFTSSGALYASLFTSGICLGVMFTWLVKQAQIKVLEVSCKGLEESIQRYLHEIDEMKSEIQGERLRMHTLEDSLQQKNSELTALKTRHSERERFHALQVQDLKKQRQNLHEDFEKLAQKVLATTADRTSQTQEKSMRLLLEPFSQQLQHFNRQVTHFQDTNVTVHASLNNELSHLKSLNTQLANEAKSLSEALKGSKKLTGNWGEIQLERCLQASGLQAGQQYIREASFTLESGKRQRPDFILKLPDDKSIVIDSKLSLIDYTKAIESKTPEGQDRALRAHVQALKNHIDNLARKRYDAITELITLDFVVMFVAVEPALVEAMKYDSTLYEYALNKNVVLAGPTTLIPILRTIGQVWLMDNSHREAYALADQAREIYRQMTMMAERLQKLGRSLQTVSGQYNDVITSVAGHQGVYSKLEKFAELSKTQQPLPDLAPQDLKLDIHRLSRQDPPILESRAVALED